MAKTVRLRTACGCERLLWCDPIGHRIRVPLRRRQVWDHMSDPADWVPLPPATRTFALQMRGDDGLDVYVEET